MASLCVGFVSQLADWSACLSWAQNLRAAPGPYQCISPIAMVSPASPKSPAVCMSAKFIFHIWSSLNSKLSILSIPYSIQIRPLLIRSHAWFDRRLEPCKAADGPTRPPGWGFRTPELQTFCSFSPLFKHCTIQESATLQKRWSVMIRRQFKASLPDLGPTLKTLLYCHWKKVTLLGSKKACSVVLCICGYDERKLWLKCWTKTLHQISSSSRMFIPQLRWKIIGFEPYYWLL